MPQNNSLSVGIDDPYKIWRHLTDVNLSNNKITILPRELGAVPHLKWLVLSNNNFGASDEFHWRWLEPTAIKNNLRFLDLSNNLLTELPACIGMLKALTELRLCHNSLTHLPQSIAKLQDLKVLKSSNNKLMHLPGSIINMQLDILDVLTNHFSSYESFVNPTDNMEPLTFFHATVMKSRLNQHVTEYCLYCKEPCFNSYIARIKPHYFTCNSVDNFIWDKQETFMCFECYCCSPNCFERLCTSQWLLAIEYGEDEENEEDEGYDLLDATINALKHSVAVQLLKFFILIGQRIICSVKWIAVEDEEDKDETVDSTLSSFCLCCMYVYKKRLTFNF